jgi:hypothetical protein
MPREVWEMLQELSFYIIIVFSAYLLIEFMEAKGWIRYGDEEQKK